MRPALIRTCCLLAVPSALPAQHAAASGKPGEPMHVAAASDEGRKAMAAFQLAPGLQVSLVAAEPDLCNAVAFAIDEQGRIYVAETFRINDGVFDTRNYMQWKDDDLACLTVDDRLAKYRKHIAADLPKYAAYSERIRLLADTDRDAVIDRSTVFADGFTELADGIAAGVLPVGQDVFFTNIPKLWRLRDRDGDGVADERAVMSDGYGVHTSLIGHDLHGLIVGPDRRLWFSIGDRGFHTVTKEGATLAYPHEGAVLRCELDGSQLEVVHRGLRNPQELAFDDCGNLFTGDNNSDGGDRARFVQVVEGGDSGWRIGYQWLDDRGAWNREQLWWPQHPGQPAFHLPPVINVADGPSGLVFDPGTGLPDRYRGCFFLCDFRGGAGYSGVHALEFTSKGAGFELLRREKPIWGVLATDVDFAPDGALYVLDWVTGWNKTGKARIYRVERPGQRNDLTLRAVANLIAADFGDRTDDQLLALLAHRDRRVRQKAQFALCDRGAVAVLLAAARNVDQRLARLHGIWGLGVLGRKDPKALDGVVALLDDGDAEVRAQAARVLGDARATDAAKKLVARLTDSSARVRFQAALALARLGNAVAAQSVPALLTMLADNDDHDPLLRHAAACALAGSGDRDRLLAAADDARRAVRLGVLLALRRLGDAEVQRFLADALPALRAEAARAIYDGDIQPALPALMAALATAAGDDPALAWRALNAARLLGTTAAVQAICSYAEDAARPASMRVEAVAILAEWSAPHGQDRVLGNWRPCAHGDLAATTDLLQRRLPPLLADDAVAAGVAAACASLHLLPAAPALAPLATARTRPVAARVAALRALDALAAAQIDAVVDAITGDDPVALRQAAVTIFAKRDPAKAAPVLATLCRKAELGERQAAFAALGELQHGLAAEILAEWLDAMALGQVEASVQLDLLEAADKRKESNVQQRLQIVRAQQDARDALAGYRECLEGGDRDAGRRIFFDNEQTRCTRCHTADGRGGNAGPRLDGIGKVQPRDYLLQSLVLPSSAIAQGFATTVIEQHNGELVAGVLTKDQDGAVELVGIDGETKVVPWDRIKQRSTSKDSAMPVMAGPLTRRQLRDVVAFLASLKTPPAK